MGQTLSGILCSDRWRVYDDWDEVSHRIEAPAAAYLDLRWLRQAQRYLSEGTAHR